jgi:hypothetical protein
VFLFIFICGLFNDTISSVGYTAGMNNEWWIENVVEGSGRGLI